MFSRILILVLVLSVSSVFASQKNSVRLEIGVETCEAYPEDCVRTNDDFYHIVGTVKGNRLTVKSFKEIDGKKVSWTRKAELGGAYSEVVAALVTQLKDTYVVRRENMPVCEIVVRPAQFVNMLSVVNAKGKLRPVYGPDGCWVSEYLFPLNNTDAARELKETLRPLIVKTAFTAQGE